MNGLIGFDLHDYDDAHVITLDELLDAEDNRLSALGYSVQEFTDADFEHVAIDDSDYIVCEVCQRVVSSNDAASDVCYDCQQRIDAAYDRADCDDYY